MIIGLISMLVVLAVLLVLINLNLIQGSVPMVSRQNVTGLGAKEVVWKNLRIAPGYSAEAYLVDCVYAVTDAGTLTNKNIESWTKALTIKGDGKMNIYAEKSCLDKVSRYLAVTGDLLPGYTYNGQTLSYSDATPVTATSTHAYYMFRGPFAGRNVSVNWVLDAANQNWPTPSVLTADFGFTIFVSKNDPRLTVSAKGQLVPSANALSVKGTYSVYMYAATAITRIRDVAINGRAMGAIQIESAKREWLVKTGAAWNAALDANVLALQFTKPANVAVTMTTTDDMYIVSLTYKQKVANRAGNPMLRKLGKMIRPKREHELYEVEGEVNPSSSQQYEGDDQY